MIVILYGKRCRHFQRQLATTFIRKQKLIKINNMSINGVITSIYKISACTYERRLHVHYDMKINSGHIDNTHVYKQERKLEKLNSTASCKVSQETMIDN